MITFTIDSLSDIFHMHQSMKDSQLSNIYFNDGVKLHKLKAIDIKRDVFDVSGMFKEIITGCVFHFNSRPSINAKLIDGILDVNELDIGKVNTGNYEVCPSVSKYCF